MKSKVAVSVEFARFRELAAKVVAVPKKELRLNGKRSDDSKQTAKAKKN